LVLDRFSSCIISSLLALSVFSTGFAHASSLIPAESSFGLDTVGYLHSTEEAPKAFQTQVSPQLVGKWNSLSKGSVAEFGVQADLLFMFTGATNGSTKPSTYFELPELYVSSSRELAPIQLHVGRKLEHWSLLDESWELGIWQPRYRWDYLHPETVGMTGAFVTVEQPYFQFVAFGSAISVPERGVPIETSGDQMSSDSRWFVPPPKTVSIFGQDTPVHYTLKIPELRDLLMHFGGGGMARVGGKSGPWGKVGYAYQPMNQLLLSNSGFLQLSERRDLFADATIYARLAYHQLLSVEGGYGSEPLNATFSVLGERPDDPGVPANQTAQRVAPSLAVSPSVDFRVAGTPGRPTRIDMSYLRQWGGNAGDVGKDAKGGTASNFEARYPFQSAVAVGVKSPFFTRVQASSRVLYDIGHDGKIWSTEVQYQPRTAWLVGMGADILSSPQNDDPENSDLIGRFRVNDRVHAGVTYVF
jgi:hypothetical protein